MLPGRRRFRLLLFVIELARCLRELRRQSTDCEPDDRTDSAAQLATGGSSQEVSGDSECKNAGQHKRCIALRGRDQ